MTKQPWYESDNPDRVVRGAVARLGVWTVIVLLAAALLGAGAWAFRVATSDVKGRGDAVVQKNRADNRIAAQQRFEERYADIKAADRRIDVAKAALTADPKDPTLRTNYTGAVQYCISQVGEYNADARKYTAEAFRSADLPSQIDDLDPATDCKENTP